MGEVIKAPNDTFFKEAFLDKHVAKDFLGQFGQTAVLQRLLRFLLSHVNN